MSSNIGGKTRSQRATRASSSTKRPQRQNHDHTKGLQSAQSPTVFKDNKALNSTNHIAKKHGHTTPLHFKFKQKAKSSLFANSNKSLSTPLDRANLQDISAADGDNNFINQNSILSAQTNANSSQKQIKQQFDKISTLNRSITRFRLRAMKSPLLRTHQAQQSLIDESPAALPSTSLSTSLQTLEQDDLEIGMGNHILGFNFTSFLKKMKKRKFFSHLDSTTSELDQITTTTQDDLINNANQDVEDGDEGHLTTVARKMKKNRRKFTTLLDSLSTKLSTPTLTTTPLNIYLKLDDINNQMKSLWSKLFKKKNKNVKRLRLRKVTNLLSNHLKSTRLTTLTIQRAFSSTTTTNPLVSRKKRMKMKYNNKRRGRVHSSFRSTTAASSSSVDDGVNSNPETQTTPMSESMQEAVSREKLIQTRENEKIAKLKQRYRRQLARYDSIIPPNSTPAQPQPDSINRRRVTSPYSLFVGKFKPQMTKMLKSVPNTPLKQTLKQRINRYLEQTSAVKNTFQAANTTSERLLGFPLAVPTISPTTHDLDSLGNHYDFAERHLGLHLINSKKHVLNVQVANQFMNRFNFGLKIGSFGQLNDVLHSFGGLNDHDINNLAEAEMYSSFLLQTLVQQHPHDDHWNGIESYLSSLPSSRVNEDQENLDEKGKPTLTFTPTTPFCPSVHSSLLMLHKLMKLTPEARSQISTASLNVLLKLIEPMVDLDSIAEEIQIRALLAENGIKVESELYDVMGFNNGNNAPLFSRDPKASPITNLNGESYSFFTWLLANRESIKLMTDYLGGNVTKNKSGEPMININDIFPQPKNKAKKVTTNGTSNNDSNDVITDIMGGDGEADAIQAAPIEFKLNISPIGEYFRLKEVNRIYHKKNSIKNRLSIFNPLSLLPKQGRDQDKATLEAEAVAISILTDQYENDQLTTFPSSLMNPLSPGDHLDAPVAVTQDIVTFRPTVTDDLSHLALSPARQKLRAERRNTSAILRQTTGQYIAEVTTGLSQHNPNKFPKKFKNFTKHHETTARFMKVIAHSTSPRSSITLYPNTSWITRHRPLRIQSALIKGDVITTSHAVFELHQRTLSTLILALNKNQMTDIAPDPSSVLASQTFNNVASRRRMQQLREAIGEDFLDKIEHKSTQNELSHFLQVSQDTKQPVFRTQEDWNSMKLSNPEATKQFPMGLLNHKRLTNTRVDLCHQDVIVCVDKLLASLGFGNIDGDNAVYQPFENDAAAEGYKIPKKANRKKFSSITALYLQDKLKHSGPGIDLSDLSISAQLPAVTSLTSILLQHSFIMHSHLVEDGEKVNNNDAESTKADTAIKPKVDTNHDNDSDDSDIALQLKLYRIATSLGFSSNIDFNWLLSSPPPKQLQNEPEVTLRRDQSINATSSNIENSEDKTMVEVVTRKNGHIKMIEPPQPSKSALDATPFDLTESLYHPGTVIDSLSTFIQRLDNHCQRAMASALSRVQNGTPNPIDNHRFFASDNPEVKEYLLSTIHNLNGIDFSTTKFGLIDGSNLFLTPRVPQHINGLEYDFPSPLFMDNAQTVINGLASRNLIHTEITPVSAIDLNSNPFARTEHFDPRLNVQQNIRAKWTQYERLNLFVGTKDRAMREHSYFLLKKLAADLGDVIPRAPLIQSPSELSSIYLLSGHVTMNLPDQVKIDRMAHFGNDFEYAVLTQGLRLSAKVTSSVNEAITQIATYPSPEQTSQSIGILPFPLRLYPDPRPVLYPTHSSVSLGVAYPYLESVEAWAPRPTSFFDLPFQSLSYLLAPYSDTAISPNNLTAHLLTGSQNTLTNPTNNHLLRVNIAKLKHKYSLQELKLEASFYTKLVTRLAQKYQKAEYKANGGQGELDLIDIDEDCIPTILPLPSDLYGDISYSPLVTDGLWADYGHDDDVDDSVTGGTKRDKLEKIMNEGKNVVDAGLQSLFSRLDRNSSPKKTPAPFVDEEGNKLDLRHQKSRGFLSPLEHGQIRQENDGLYIEGEGDEANDEQKEGDSRHDSRYQDESAELMGAYELKGELAMQRVHANEANPNVSEYDPTTVLQLVNRNQLKKSSLDELHSNDMIGDKVQMTLLDYSRKVAKRKNHDFLHKLVTNHQVPILVKTAVLTYLPQNSNLSPEELESLTLEFRQSINNVQHSHQRELAQLKRHFTSSDKSRQVVTNDNIGILANASLDYASPFEDATADRYFDPYAAVLPISNLYKESLKSIANNQNDPLHHSLIYSTSQSHYGFYGKQLLDPIANKANGTLFYHPHDSLARPLISSPYLSPELYKLPQNAPANVKKLAQSQSPSSILYSFLLHDQAMGLQYNAVLQRLFAATEELPIPPSNKGEVGHIYAKDGARAKIVFLPFPQTTNPIHMLRPNMFSLDTMDPEGDNDMIGGVGGKAATTFKPLYNNLASNRGDLQSTDPNCYKIYQDTRGDLTDDYFRFQLPQFERLASLDPKQAEILASYQAGVNRDIDTSATIAGYKNDTAKKIRSVLDFGGVPVFLHTPTYSEPFIKNPFEQYSDVYVDGHGVRENILTERIMKKLTKFAKVLKNTHKSTPHLAKSRLAIAPPGENAPAQQQNNEQVDGGDQAVADEDIAAYNSMVTPEQLKIQSFEEESLPKSLYQNLLLTQTAALFEATMFPTRREMNHRNQVQDDIDADGDDEDSIAAWGGEEPDTSQSTQNKNNNKNKKFTCTNGKLITTDSIDNLFSSPEALAETAVLSQRNIDAMSVNSLKENVSKQLFAIRNFISNMPFHSLSTIDPLAVKRLRIMLTSLPGNEGIITFDHFIPKWIESLDTAKAAQQATINHILESFGTLHNDPVKDHYDQRLLEDKIVLSYFAHQETAKREQLTALAKHKIDPIDPIGYLGRVFNDPKTMTELDNEAAAAAAAQKRKKSKKGKNEGLEPSFSDAPFPLGDLSNLVIDRKRKSHLSHLHQKYLRTFLHLPSYVSDEVALSYSSQILALNHSHLSKLPTGFDLELPPAGVINWSKMSSTRLASAHHQMLDFYLQNPSAIFSNLSPSLPTTIYRPEPTTPMFNPSSLIPHLNLKDSRLLMKPLFTEGDEIDVKLHENFYANPWFFAFNSDGTAVDPTLESIPLTRRTNFTNWYESAMDNPTVNPRHPSGAYLSNRFVASTNFPTTQTTKPSNFGEMSLIGADVKTHSQDTQDMISALFWDMVSIINGSKYQSLLNPLYFSYQPGFSGTTASSARNLSTWSAKAIFEQSGHRKGIDPLHFNDHYFQQYTSQSHLLSLQQQATGSQTRGDNGALPWVYSPFTPTSSRSEELLALKPRLTLDHAINTSWNQVTLWKDQLRSLQAAMMKRQGPDASGLEELHTPDGNILYSQKSSFLSKTDLSNNINLTDAEIVGPERVDFTTEPQYDNDPMLEFLATNQPSLTGPLHTRPKIAAVLRTKYMNRLKTRRRHLLHTSLPSTHVAPPSVFRKVHQQMSVAASNDHQTLLDHSFEPMDEIDAFKVNASRHRQEAKSLYRDPFRAGTSLQLAPDQPISRGVFAIPSSPAKKDELLHRPSKSRRPDDPSSKSKLPNHWTRLQIYRFKRSVRRLVMTTKAVARFRKDLRAAHRQVDKISDPAEWTLKYDSTDPKAASTGLYYNEDQLFSSPQIKESVEQLGHSSAKYLNTPYVNHMDVAVNLQTIFSYIQSHQVDPLTSLHSPESFSSVSSLPLASSSQFTPSNHYLGTILQSLPHYLKLHLPTLLPIVMSSPIKFASQTQLEYEHQLSRIWLGRLNAHMPYFNNLSAGKQLPDGVALLEEKRAAFPSLFYDMHTASYTELMAYKTFSSEHHVESPLLPNVRQHRVPITSLGLATQKHLSMLYNDISFSYDHMKPFELMPISTPSESSPTYNFLSKQSNMAVSPFSMTDSAGLHQRDSITMGELQMGSVPISAMHDRTSAYHEHLNRIMPDLLSAIVHSDLFRAKQSPLLHQRTLNTVVERYRELHGEPGEKDAAAAAMGTVRRVPKHKQLHSIPFSPQLTQVVHFAQSLFDLTAVAHEYLHTNHDCVPASHFTNRGTDAVANKALMGSAPQDLEELEFLLYGTQLSNSISQDSHLGLNLRNRTGSITRQEHQNFRLRAVDYLTEIVHQGDPITMVTADEQEVEYDPQKDFEEATNGGGEGGSHLNNEDGPFESSSMNRRHQSMIGVDGEDHMNRHLNHDGGDGGPNFRFNSYGDGMNGQGDMMMSKSLSDFTQPRAFREGESDDEGQALANTGTGDYDDNGYLREYSVGQHLKFLMHAQEEHSKLLARRLNTSGLSNLTNIGSDGNTVVVIQADEADINNISSELSSVDYEQQLATKRQHEEDSQKYYEQLRGELRSRLFDSYQFYVQQMLQPPLVLRLSPATTALACGITHAAGVLQEPSLRALLMDTMSTFSQPTPKGLLELSNIQLAYNPTLTRQQTQTLEKANAGYISNLMRRQHELVHALSTSLVSKGKNDRLNPILAKMSIDLNANLSIQEQLDVYGTNATAALHYSFDSTRVQRMYDEYQFLNEEIIRAHNDKMINASIQHEVDRNHMAAAGLTLAKVLMCDVSLLLTGADLRYNPLFPPQSHANATAESTRGHNLTSGVSALSKQLQSTYFKVAANRHDQKMKLQHRVSILWSPDDTITHHSYIEPINNQIAPGETPLDDIDVSPNNGEFSQLNSLPSEYAQMGTLHRQYRNIGVSGGQVTEAELVTEEVSPQGDQKVKLWSLDDDDDAIPTDQNKPRRQKGFLTPDQLPKQKQQSLPRFYSARERAWNHPSSKEEDLTVDLNTADEGNLLTRRIRGLNTVTDSITGIDYPVHPFVDTRETTVSREQVLLERFRAITDSGAKRLLSMTSADHLSLNRLGGTSSIEDFLTNELSFLWGKTDEGRDMSRSITNQILDTAIGQADNEDHSQTYRDTENGANDLTFDVKQEMGDFLDAFRDFEPTRPNETAPAGRFGHWKYVELYRRYLYHEAMEQHREELFQAQYGQKQFYQAFVAYMPGILFQSYLSMVDQIVPRVTAYRSMIVLPIINRYSLFNQHVDEFSTYYSRRNNPVAQQDEDDNFDAQQQIDQHNSNNATVASKKKSEYSDFSDDSSGDYDSDDFDGIKTEKSKSSRARNELDPFGAFTTYLEPTGSASTENQNASQEMIEQVKQINTNKDSLQGMTSDFLLRFSLRRAVASARHIHYIPALSDYQTVPLYSTVFESFNDLRRLKAKTGAKNNLFSGITQAPDGSYNLDEIFGEDQDDSASGDEKGTSVPASGVLRKRKTKFNGVPTEGLNPRAKGQYYSNYLVSLASAESNPYGLITDRFGHQAADEEQSDVYSNAQHLNSAHLLIETGPTLYKRINPKTLQNMLKLQVKMYDRYRDGTIDSWNHSLRFYKGAWNRFWDPNNVGDNTIDQIRAALLNRDAKNKANAAKAKGANETSASTSTSGNNNNDEPTLQKTLQELQNDAILAFTAKNLRGEKIEKMLAEASQSTKSVINNQNLTETVDILQEQMRLTEEILIERYAHGTTRLRQLVNTLVDDVKHTDFLLREELKHSILHLPHIQGLIEQLSGQGFDFQSPHRIKINTVTSVEELIQLQAQSPQGITIDNNGQMVIHMYSSQLDAVHDNTNTAVREYRRFQSVGGSANITKGLFGKSLPTSTNDDEKAKFSAAVGGKDTEIPLVTQRDLALKRLYAYIGLDQVLLYSPDGSVMRHVRPTTELHPGELTEFSLITPEHPLRRGHTSVTLTETFQQFQQLDQDKIIDVDRVNGGLGESIQYRLRSGGAFTAGLPIVDEDIIEPHYTISPFQAGTNLPTAESFLSAKVDIVQSKHLLPTIFKRASDVFFSEIVTAISTLNILNSTSDRCEGGAHPIQPRYSPTLLSRYADYADALQDDQNLRSPLLGQTDFASNRFVDPVAQLNAKKPHESVSAPSAAQQFGNEVNATKPVSAAGRKVFGAKAAALEGFSMKTYGLTLASPLNKFHTIPFLFNQEYLFNLLSLCTKNYLHVELLQLANIVITSPNIPDRRTLTEPFGVSRVSNNNDDDNAQFSYKIHNPFLSYDSNHLALHRRGANLDQDSLALLNDRQRGRIQYEHQKQQHLGQFNSSKPSYAMNYLRGEKLTPEQERNNITGLRYSLVGEATKDAVRDGNYYNLAMPPNDHEVALPSHAHQTPWVGNQGDIRRTVINNVMMMYSLQRQEPLDALRFWSSIQFQKKQIHLDNLMNDWNQFISLAEQTPEGSDYRVQPLAHTFLGMLHNTIDDLVRLPKDYSPIEINQAQQGQNQDQNDAANATHSNLNGSGNDATDSKNSSFEYDLFGNLKKDKNKHQYDGDDESFNHFISNFNSGSSTKMMGGGDGEPDYYGDSEEEHRNRYNSDGETISESDSASSSSSSSNKEKHNANKKRQKEKKDDGFILQDELEYTQQLLKQQQQKMPHRLQSFDTIYPIGQDNAFSSTQLFPMALSLLAHPSHIETLFTGSFADLGSITAGTQSNSAQPVIDQSPTGPGRIGQYYSYYRHVFAIFDSELLSEITVGRNALRTLPRNYVTGSHEEGWSMDGVPIAKGVSAGTKSPIVDEYEQQFGAYTTQQYELYDRFIAGQDAMINSYQQQCGDILVDYKAKRSAQLDQEDVDAAQNDSTAGASAAPKRAPLPLHLDPRSEEYDPYNDPALQALLPPQPPQTNFEAQPFEFKFSHHDTHRRNKLTSMYLISALPLLLHDLQLNKEFPTYIDPILADIIHYTNTMLLQHGLPTYEMVHGKFQHVLNESLPGFIDDLKEETVLYRRDAAKLTEMVMGSNEHSPDGTHQVEPQEQPTPQPKIINTDPSVPQPTNRKLEAAIESTLAQLRPDDGSGVTQDSGQGRAFLTNLLNTFVLNNPSTYFTTPFTHRTLANTINEHSTYSHLASVANGQANHNNPPKLQTDHMPHFTFEQFESLNFSSFNMDLILQTGLHFSTVKPALADLTLQSHYKDVAAVYYNDPSHRHDPALSRIFNQFEGQGTGTYRNTIDPAAYPHKPHDPRGQRPVEVDLASRSTQRSSTTQATVHSVYKPTAVDVPLLRNWMQGLIKEGQLDHGLSPFAPHSVANKMSKHYSLEDYNFTRSVDETLFAKHNDPTSPYYHQSRLIHEPTNYSLDSKLDPINGQRPFSDVKDPFMKTTKATGSEPGQDKMKPIEDTDPAIRTRQRPYCRDENHWFENISQTYNLENDWLHSTAMRHTLENPYAPKAFNGFVGFGGIKFLSENGGHHRLRVVDPFKNTEHTFDMSTDERPAAKRFTEAQLTAYRNGKTFAAKQDFSSLQAQVSQADAELKRQDRLQRESEPPRMDYDKSSRRKNGQNYRNFGQNGQAFARQVSEQQEEKQQQEQQQKQLKQQLRQQQQQVQKQIQEQKQQQKQQELKQRELKQKQQNFAPKPWEQEEKPVADKPKRLNPWDTPM